MNLADVPVQFCDPLVVCLIKCKPLVGPRIVIETGLQDVAYGLEIRFQDTGSICLANIRGILRNITRCFILTLLCFKIYKVEQLALFYRATQRKTGLELT